MAVYVPTILGTAFYQESQWNTGVWFRNGYTWIMIYEKAYKNLEQSCIHEETLPIFLTALNEQKRDVSHSRVFPPLQYVSFIMVQP